MATKVPGYIGWIGHLQQGNLSKLYASNMSNTVVDELFHSFASKFDLN